MNRFDEALFAYADKFGENFPTFEYPYLTEAEIIQMVEECLNTGEPMKTADEDITI